MDAGSGDSEILPQHNMGRSRTKFFEDDVLEGNLLKAGYLFTLRNGSCHCETRN
jgi:hypothetical protein